MDISLSFITGQGNLDHNNRTFISDNIDKARIKDNIIYKRESLEKAYDNLFGKYIEEYNEKQKRKDRQINGVKGYIKDIKESNRKEKLFYENIVMLGDKYTVGSIQNNREDSIDVLDNYMKSFQERNPNLYVFNAVLHLDESTPHLHINYIPYSNGYKNGLQRRNSWNRALKDMGFENKGQRNNAIMAWQNREKEVIKSLTSDTNLNIVDMNSIDRKQVSVKDYKLAAELVKKEIGTIPIPDLEELKDLGVKETLTSKFSDKKTISMPKEVYDELIESFVKSTLYNEQMENIIKEENKIKEKQIKVYKELKEERDGYIKMKSDSEKELEELEESNDYLYYRSRKLEELNDNLHEKNMELEKELKKYKKKDKRKSYNMDM